MKTTFRHGLILLAIVFTTYMHYGMLDQLYMYATTCHLNLEQHIYIHVCNNMSSKSRRLEHILVRKNKFFLLSSLNSSQIVEASVMILTEV